MTCDDFHQTIVMLDKPASALAGLPDVSGHAASCSGCREWFGRYVDGASQWAEDGLAGGLATSVLRRTSGEGCSSARTRLASAYDDELDRADRLLLDEHLAGCDGCRVFRQTLSATLAALPSLADLEPDRAFVGDVLARTSRRPARAGWFVHVQDTWQRVVQRPRFAWEAAYVCTLCWLLLFGQPMAAFDWTSARVSAVAHTAAEKSSQLPSIRKYVPTSSPELPAPATLARAAERLAGSPEAVSVAAQNVWQRAGDWTMARLSGLADAVVSMWQSVAAWVGDLFASPQPAASAPAAARTEPSAAPAR